MRDPSYEGPSPEWDEMQTFWLRVGYNLRRFLIMPLDGEEEGGDTCEIEIHLFFWDLRCGRGTSVSRLRARLELGLWQR